MDKKKYLPIFLTLFCLVLIQQAQAQLSVSAQVRTRTEYRNGQGNPTFEDAEPAIFTSQRSRLNIGYAGYRFKIYTSLQDVRVWGQDQSSINRFTLDANDGLMLHEAWAELSLVDTGKVIKNFTVKIGRQELVYDDVRLLGNLDWLQQARRHDAIVFKFDHKGWTAHLGGAFNQNREQKAGAIFNPIPTAGTYPASTNGIGAMYKSMQFLYVGRKLHFGNASFLLFKDDFNEYRPTPTPANPAAVQYKSGVWSRYTTGVNLFGTVARKITFALSAFSQTGRYRDGTQLNEYLLSASGLYQAGRKFQFGPGVDVTSGDGKTPNKRFDPLYGTPHKFWGYMDYFYVADGFGAANGLVNPYLKGRFKAKDNLTLSLDVHQFILPEGVKDADGKAMDKKLGTEIDFVMTYNMTKAVTIEGGYSYMKSTATMTAPSVKPAAAGTKPDHSSTWAYLMINIKPAEFLVKN